MCLVHIVDPQSIFVEWINGAITIGKQQMYVILEFINRIRKRWLDYSVMGRHPFPNYTIAYYIWKENTKKYSKGPRYKDTWNPVIRIKGTGEI